MVAAGSVPLGSGLGFGGFENEVLPQALFKGLVLMDGRPVMGFGVLPRFGIE